MMDWTDRHCRSFHHLIAPQAWLYSEMITSAAIVHGDRDRLLGRGEEGSRSVLQLGGNDPAELAVAAAHGERYGYAEINLNCGCPSDRVRSGCFGASLMADPLAVGRMVRAMQDAVSVPVTVKHRIGIDRREDYSFVQDFVGTLVQAGCRRFIVHARNAWLDGLSPKENREIPPLRYEVVHRLALEFPQAMFELNGGLKDAHAGTQAASGLAGAMYGRAAYHDPWMLRDCTDPGAGANADAAAPTRAQVVDALVQYLRRHAAQGVQLRHLSRHVLGLYRGTPGARRWRQVLSDSAVLSAAQPETLLKARDALGAAG